MWERTDTGFWRHAPSGVLFREVPAGTFRMGLSEAEEATLAGLEFEEGGLTAEDLRQMRPVREVRVDAFLMAWHPLTVAQVRHWLPDYDDEYAGDDDHRVARLEWPDELLEALPFRLPTEAEWEYAARAGTTTLWHRGDMRPGEDAVLDSFGDPAVTTASENPFGLAAMGATGDLCADVYVDGYADAPTDARPRHAEDAERVVRGGAADLYPWQGVDEWLMLLPTTRYEFGEFASIRPVAPLP
ncbi:formylglycine-generating enzyme required for sulfatase activity [Catenuloplanes nepalensis]|uniref:Formylglycine-generating enzyme required for sulfatase activity n=1 Tax=Catenuloplanes nepalensis TaxID=587533 RepID=A0ABT9MTJ0_9ACTN|nr:SUMF1/EgtB/PvdO family nonheme iron enzyme [Catenuloplanes nepalensis]MDP9794754.1 formylglycine-generating enzyme required for sulfatase activity [Catenuloplanes nepalensis]